MLCVAACVCVCVFMHFMDMVRGAEQTPERPGKGQIGCLQKQKEQQNPCFRVPLTDRQAAQTHVTGDLPGFQALKCSYDGVAACSGVPIANCDPTRYSILANGNWEAQLSKGVGQ